MRMLDTIRNVFGKVNYASYFYGKEILNYFINAYCLETYFFKVIQIITKISL